MKTYQRLNINERENLSRYLAMDYSYRQIANLLERPASTISREVHKHGFNRLSYRGQLAQQESQRLRSIPRKKRKLDKNLILQRTVVNYLELRWSPEQIAKRLKNLYPWDMDMQVSHETIYAYLYIHPRGAFKRRLIGQLRRKHINRRVKDKERKKTSPIQNFISIEERPIEANHRTIAGHWEGDLIMGALNKSAIGTLVERKTRLTLLVKLIKKDATSVREAFTHKFNSLPTHIKKSLTYDQGQEMAQHQKFTEDTQIQVYFAHPHSPWERGTSENTNMLIRDFYPKGTDFSKISESELLKVQELLNDRPRKVLGFYTPNEIFTKTVALAT
jgi:IS30 family transposase